MERQDGRVAPDAFMGEQHEGRAHLARKVTCLCIGDEQMRGDQGSRTQSGIAGCTDCCTDVYTPRYTQRYNQR